MTELSTVVPQPQTYPEGRPRLSFDLRLGEGLGKIREDLLVRVQALEEQLHAAQSS